jgi:hypothetical protein
VGQRLNLFVIMALVWLNRNNHVVLRSTLVFTCSTCPCVGCENCSPQAQPEIQLVISGVANSTCTGCSTLNGTFILRNEGSNYSDYCIWEYNPSGGTTCSDFTNLRCQFDVDGDIEVNWEGVGTIEWFSITGLTTFGTTGPGGFNCSTINNFSIPYSITLGTTQCIGTGSSCRLTAL